MSLLEDGPVSGSSHSTLRVRSTCNGSRMGICPQMFTDLENFIKPSTDPLWLHICLQHKASCSVHAVECPVPHHRQPSTWIPHTACSKLHHRHHHAVSIRRHRQRGISKAYRTRWRGRNELSFSRSSESRNLSANFSRHVVKVQQSFPSSHVCPQSFDAEYGSWPCLCRFSGRFASFNRLFWNGRALLRQQSPESVGRLDTLRTIMARYIATSSSPLSPGHGSAATLTYWICHLSQ